MNNSSIRFICDFDNMDHYTPDDLLRLDYPKLTDEKYESLFTIEISGKEFFSESYINTLELLQQIEKWKLEKGDFLYNCIDTEDNPLLSFVKEKDGLYSIKSPWQKFECCEHFDYNDLINIEEILEG